MNDREKELTNALRDLLRVVETFPPETADVRAVYADATVAARDVLKTNPKQRRESRKHELVA